VIAQTYQNWECIVVDDGSTDRTRKVVQSYCDKDSRIKLFSRPKDRPKGANACRNFGFEMSRGSLITWLDSDDLFTQSKIERQAKLLQVNSTDYCVSFCDTINHESGVISRRHVSRLESDSPLESFMVKDIFWLLPAVLWNKEFLKLSGLRFDESLHQMQDFDFHVRALELSTNYCSLEETTVILLDHSGNMSKSRFDSTEKIRSNVNVYWGIIQRHRVHISESTLRRLSLVFLIMFGGTMKERRFGLAIDALLKFLKVAVYGRFSNRTIVEASRIIGISILRVLMFWTRQSNLCFHSEADSRILFLIKSDLRGICR